MRMPCAPIEISTSLSALPGLGRSILISGGLRCLPSALADAAGGLGGVGAAGTITTRGRTVSIRSEIGQLNGGRFCRMPAKISSSSANRKKRFHVIDTSQVA